MLDDQMDDVDPSLTPHTYDPLVPPLRPSAPERQKMPRCTKTIRGNIGVTWLRTAVTPTGPVDFGPGPGPVRSSSGAGRRRWECSRPPPGIHGPTTSDGTSGSSETEHVGTLKRKSILLEHCIETRLPFDGNILFKR